MSHRPRSVKFRLRLLGPPQFGQYQGDQRHHPDRHDAVSIPGGRTAQTATMGDVARAHPLRRSPDYVNVFPNPVEDQLNVEIGSVFNAGNPLFNRVCRHQGSSRYIPQGGKSGWDKPCCGKNFSGLHAEWILHYVGTPVSNSDGFEFSK